MVYTTRFLTEHSILPATLLLSNRSIRFPKHKLTGPVFFLEIKPPGHVNDIVSRIAADDLMRDRFRNLYDLTPLPRLHGTSAMGQRLAFYCLDKATGNVEPEYVERSRSRVTDVVPANMWVLDITTAAGYERFMEVVNDAKGMCKDEK
ncbi:hypothetical protein JOM56_004632 [Amanita muscaria]